MKWEVRIGTRVRQIEVRRIGPRQFAVVSEHSTDNVDAVELAPNTYSILLDGRVFEAVVIAAKNGLLVRCNGREFMAAVSDPRAWRRGGADLFGAEGKQQVTAPMPGKVVRVLVSAGQAVEANQGLVVIEAMKMQNEIRAPKAGTIERILIREGQAVAAGEALATIN